MTNDYDVALAQTQNSKIAWVAPSEGTSGYLEGWVAVSQSDQHPVCRGVRELPSRAANYASFVDATGTSYIEPGARPHMSPAIANEQNDRRVRA